MIVIGDGSCKSRYSFLGKGYHCTVIVMGHVTRKIRVWLSLSTGLVLSWVTQYVYRWGIILLVHVTSEIWFSVRVTTGL